jgi:hypothetical protein
VKFTKGPAEFHCDLPRRWPPPGGARAPQRLPLRRSRVLDLNRAPPARLLDQPMPDERQAARPARPGGEDRIPGCGEALRVLAPSQPVGAPSRSVDTAGTRQHRQEHALPLRCPAIGTRTHGHRRKSRNGWRGRWCRNPGHAREEHKKNKYARLAEPAPSLHSRRPQPGGRKDPARRKGGALKGAAGSLPPARHQSGDEAGSKR